MEKSALESEDFVQDKLLLDVLHRSKGGDSEISSLESLADESGEEAVDSEDEEGGQEKNAWFRRRSGKAFASMDRDPDRAEFASRPGREDGERDARSLPFRPGSGLGWIGLGFLLQMGFLVGMAAVLLPQVEGLVSSGQGGIGERGSARPAATTESEADLHPEMQVSLELEEQLRVLKERTRLSSFADRAIANADREAYDDLTHQLAEEIAGRGAGLTHAAQAELLKVKFFYANSNRLGPYKLPVGELYSDPLIQDEADLSTSQLLGLLEIAENENWANRARAARLLGGRSNTHVNDALASAMETETNLEVLRELSYSFQENTGYRGDVFDVAALQAWWAEQEVDTRGPEKAASEAG